jgi:hypothetical protein
MAMTLLLLPLLVVASAGAAPAPKALSCADQAAVDAFRRRSRGVLGVEDAGEGWLRCLCGKSLDRLKPTGDLPEEPSFAPAFPAFSGREPDASMRRASSWYVEWLPVSAEQAAALTNCAYGRLYSARAGKPWRP